MAPASPTSATRPSTSNRVYLGGTFDLLHPGHLNILRQASALGEVWVALNTDEFCERYKRRPVMTFQERRHMLRACVYVTGVVPNYGGEDSRPAIEAVKPRYILHGDDWTGDSYLAQLGVTEEWLKKRNIHIVHVPYTAGISTSEVIQRCVSHSSEPSTADLRIPSRFCIACS